MTKKISEENIKDYIFLINILASVLNNTPPPKIHNNINWKSIYAKAGNHSLRTMLYYGIKKYNEKDVPKELINLLKNARKTAILREANQEYETKIIINDFEKNKIKNMPLKGYWLKHSYPQLDMRSMSDIDILFNINQLKEVDLVLKNLSFTSLRSSGTHHCYEKGQFMFLEMQDSLVDKDDINRSYFEKTWERAKPYDNYKYSYKLNIEDYYVYMIAHLAKHFVIAGAGIRMVMDVYVFNKKHISSLNKDIITKKLKETKLYDFENFIKDIAFKWFSEKSNTNLSNISEVEEFIFLSNTFGRSSISILQRTLAYDKDKKNKNKESSKFLYVISKIFPSLSLMKEIYPTLVKAPILYPAFWCYHWFHRLFISKTVYIDHIKKHVKLNNKEEVNYYKGIINKAGLNNSE